jgi:hypothetical protein
MEGRAPNVPGIPAEKTVRWNGESLYFLFYRNSMLHNRLLDLYIADSLLKNAGQQSDRKAARLECEQKTVWRRMPYIMGGHVEGSEIIPWVISFAVFFVVPFWKLFKRTGFKPVFSIIALIPGGVVLLLWVVAFAKWPAFAEKKKDSDPSIVEKKKESSPPFVGKKKDSSLLVAEETKDSGSPVAKEKMDSGSLVVEENRDSGPTVVEEKKDSGPPAAEEKMDSGSLVVEENRDSGPTVVDEKKDSGPPIPP